MKELNMTDVAKELDFTNSKLIKFLIVTLVLPFWLCCVIVSEAATIVSEIIELYYIILKN